MSARVCRQAETVAQKGVNCTCSTSCWLWSLLMAIEMSVLLTHCSWFEQKWSADVITSWSQHAVHSYQGAKMPCSLSFNSQSPQLPIPSNFYYAALCAQLKILQQLKEMGAAWNKLNLTSTSVTQGILEWVYRSRWRYSINLAWSINQTAVWSVCLLLP